MVFYRKYRPQKIEEIDSENVRERILSVLSKKEIPHAFLFTGPKGLGKTSTARILAKAVNCEKRKGAEPCNKCNQCTSITNGTNLDVLEIDAASNRGIDEIRDLREKIRLAPISALQKVYIIDEVHMLTTEAFNALLKTLEEPPPHALFVLCTTEPQKVPATIVSRCFHIPFKLASKDEIERSLKRIIKSEKIGINNEALGQIAKLSDGSFRDGTKLLEELALFSGRKKITKNLVEEKLNVSGLSIILGDLMDGLFRRDAKYAFGQVKKLVDQGADAKYVIEQLVNNLHHLLLVKFNVASASALDKENAQRIGERELKELVEILSKAYSELKYAVLPQLPLELAIVEWGLRSGVEVGTQNGFGSQLESVAKDSGASANTKHFGASPRQKLDRNILQELIEKVKPYNHSVAGVLRGCSVKSYDGKKLVIETGYKFHKERLEEKKTRELLEKLSEEVIGSKVTLLVQFKV